MSAVQHFTEYTCERCKRVERRTYGHGAPPAWRWFGKDAHTIDGLYARGLLCGSCEGALEEFLGGAR